MQNICENTFEIIYLWCKSCSNLESDPGSCLPRLKKAWCWWGLAVGGKGLWCCSWVPGGPSTAHGTERLDCEKWGLETKSISSLTVFLQGKEGGKGWRSDWKISASTGLLQMAGFLKYFKMLLQSFTVLLKTKTTISFKLSSGFKFSSHPTVSKNNRKNRLHLPLFHTFHATHKEEGKRGNIHSRRDKVDKERDQNITRS